MENLDRYVNFWTVFYIYIIILEAYAIQFINHPSFEICTRKMHAYDHIGRNKRCERATCISLYI
jgi:hypothetical protein